MADDALRSPNSPLFPAIPWGWKFTEATTAELSRRLAAAGPGARLSLLPYVSGDLLLMRLRVVGADGMLVEQADLNDAFPCPPFQTCSGGG